jgi:arylsulfatase A-like enzyme
MDNVVLLDRTLGEIRLTLEKAGMWDDSTILLTSDHSLRIGLARDRPRPTWERALQGVKQSREVPFLLKMAGQQEGFAYDAAMQTVVTKDLLLAIMKGEVRQPEQVALWLDHHPPHQ